MVKEGREEKRRGGPGHRMAGMMRNRYRVGHLIPSHFPFPPLLYVNKVWKLFLFSFGIRGVVITRLVVKNSGKCRIKDMFLFGKKLTVKL